MFRVTFRGERTKAVTRYPRASASSRTCPPMWPVPPRTKSRRAMQRRPGSAAKCDWALRACSIWSSIHPRSNALADGGAASRRAWRPQRAARRKGTARPCRCRRLGTREDRCSHFRAQTVAVRSGGAVASFGSARRTSPGAGRTHRARHGSVVVEIIALGGLRSRWTIARFVRPDAARNAITRPSPAAGLDARGVHCTDVKLASHGSSKRRAPFLVLDCTQPA